MLLSQKVIFLFCFISLLLSPLQADTVLYKNGKEYKNVKTRISRGTILISFENGKTESVSKKDIQKVKFAMTIWKPPVKDLKTSVPPEQILEQEQEKERLAEETQEGSEWEERPEADKISPMGNASLALIPGYSGLYRTEKYVGAGIFSAIELGLLASIYKTDRDLKSLRQTYKQDSNQNNILPFLAIQSSNVSFFFYSIYRGSISLPEMKSQISDLESVQNAQAASLGFVLLLDAFSSYYSANDWNEGTYKGESAPLKATTPISRAWRSAIFPGWGQYYAGDKSKGLGLVSLSGVSLLFTFFQQSREKRHEENKTDYTRFNLRSFSTFSFLLNSGILENYRRVLDSTTPGTTEYDNALASLNLFTPQYNAFAIISLSGYRIDQKNLQRSQDAKEAKEKALAGFAALWVYGIVDAYFFSGRNPDSENTGKLSFMPTFSVSPVGYNGRHALEQNVGFSLGYSW